MALQNPYKILGIKPGATEREIKQAYRQQALRYHPDLNSDPDAAERFREIQAAYDHLSGEGPVAPATPEYTWDEVRDEIRRDRERMAQQARVRREKKKKEEDFFKQGEWHDILLFLRYFIHGFAIVFSIAAIILPIILAIFVGAISLVGTAYFIIIGGFLVSYIYKRRRTWFKLGKFRLTKKDILGFFKMPVAGPYTGHCCFMEGAPADGKPVRVEMINIQDVTVRSYGAMDHYARYKSKVRHIVLPRSSRAQYWHRMATMIKLSFLLGCVLFLPLTSVLWRFFAGLVSGGIVSQLLLRIVRVKEKNSYLLTPGLLIKAILWLLAMLVISRFGPGFDVRLTSSVYIVVAGMLFLLDMLFDLVMGLFPFYRRLFRPIRKQGDVMSQFYEEGYQNYHELPVYSVLYPLYRWLF